MSSRTPYLLLFLAAVGACAAPGCMLCPDGDISIVAGDWPLTPGAEVSFKATYGQTLISAPYACGGIWEVNGVEGGTEETGQVNECGYYVAPDVTPLDPVTVSASRYGHDECMDCCPYASITIEFIEPDLP